jgi:hypothetical protein
VHVWADPNPPGMVFDRWIGDTTLLRSTRESHTKLRTAHLNINITATYKAAPTWNPTFETLNGIQIGHFFPSSPAGVIFHFHGQGGAANLLFSNLERRIFANEAVAEGYAVVALDSADRINRDWSTSNDLATSSDIQNVQAAINLFISRGLITASTPLFAHGFSKGAGFSPRVARALNFRATSMNLLAGTPDIINITTILLSGASRRTTGRSCRVVSLSRGTTIRILLTGECRLSIISPSRLPSTRNAFGASQV